MYNKIDDLGELTIEELHDVLYYYDAYIQEANDMDKYQDGWYPVCISEFYMCDYEAWKNNSEHGTDKVYVKTIVIEPVYVSEFYECDHEARKNNSEHGRDKVYEKTIVIDKPHLDRINYLVEQTHLDFEVEGLIEDSTVESYTAVFPDGCEADVKLCAGQTNCFLDAVLFDSRGHEVCCPDCPDSLGDEIEFEYNNTLYIVRIKEK